MRLLIHGFSDTEAISRGACDVIAATPAAEAVGWVARRRFRWVRELAPCRVFDEPLPDGAWQVSLDADPLLGMAEPMADENFRYLIDREEHFTNPYEITLRRSQVMCYSQEILDATDAHAVLFSDVPHSALGYGLYLVARERGIQTLYFRYGPAPHLFTFADGFGPRLLNFVSERVRAEFSEPSQFAQEYVERLGGAYLSAQPAYMRRQASRTGVLARAREVAVGRPSQLLSRENVAKTRAQLRRERLRREYELRAVDVDDLGSDFVVQFLHLQPERSTVPEGGAFAQQWLVAHAIARSLPPGWTMAVREHPSTFSTGPRLVRSASFYDALLSIPGVRLVSLDSDPFAAIDRARMAATVTGTVGLESIARGKPALVFGDASYRGCRGAFEVDTVATVAKQVRAAEGIETDPSDVLALLARFEASQRVFVHDGHGGDVDAAVDAGVAHHGVLERMFDHLGIVVPT